jgi:hypothetical protein
VPEQQDDVKAKKRKRANAIGCAILVAIALALGIYTIWSMGQAGRDAERAKQAIHPGMTVAEVEGLLAGVQVVKSYETGSGADAKVSSAETFIKDLAAQIKGDGRTAAGHLYLTFYGGSPARISFSVEFGADGKVSGVSDSRFWD